MRLAIIIPYYRLRFFKQTLLSLAAQTDKRFTVYIGDDASPENPLELLSQFEGQFEFNYKRFDDNLGGTSLVGQWHRCLETVKDEQWLMILGDDDVLDSDCVAEFYRQLPEIGDARVMRYATQKIDADGKATSEVFTHDKRENAVDFLFNKQRSSLSEYIFATNAVRTIKFKDFPLAWFSDVLGVLEFSNFGTIYSINEAVVHIRISNANISGRKDNLKLKFDAVFLFHAYLLGEKSQHFNAGQRDALFESMTKGYMSNKKSIRHFLKLTGLYFKFGKSADYFVFLKSFLKQVIGF